MSKNLLIPLLLSVMTMSLTSADAAVQQRRQRADLLVLGGTLVTMDGTRRIIEDGALAISSGRIIAIGPRTEIQLRYVAKEVIEARGHLIIPGLINGHTHIPMTLFRAGMADEVLFPGRSQKRYRGFCPGWNPAGFGRNDSRRYDNVL
jgi:5-methylthioadenosine/S-adenosylhomocysteine deaminase